MALKPPTRGSLDSQDASDAYAAYQGLCFLVSLRPDLIENEYFNALKDTAFARFLSTYEAL